MGESSAYRWGLWCARHARRVLAAWAVLLVVAGGLTSVFLGRLSGSELSVPGSGSARAQALIAKQLVRAPEERDLLVFHSPTLTVAAPAFRRTVAEALTRLRGRSLVAALISPYAAHRRLVAADRHTALATVSLRGTDQQRQAAVTRYQSALDGLGGSRVSVDLTGTSPINAALVKRENADLRFAEGVGVAIAGVVLLLAFGTVSAALVPVAVGAAGLLLAFGILGAASFGTTWNVFVESTLAMVGIALGIDYSLFLVTRYREERASGAEVDVAVARTMATSGRAVAFSGTTVLISLSGLLLVNTSFFRQMAYGVILAAASMLAVSQALLPALLGLLGDRVNRWRLPHVSGHVEGFDPERGAWARLANGVMRRPVLVGAAAATALLALASPVRNLALGYSADVGALSATSAGSGYTLVKQDFSPGLVSPVQVVAHNPSSPIGSRFLRHLAARASTTRGIQGVIGSPQVSPSRHTALLELAPAQRADATASINAVRRLREHVVPALTAGSSTRVFVGGSSARIRDLETVTDAAMPRVLGTVLGASLLLLLLAFRSILLPLKAIFMNLLSLGAAYGAVILVFQQGHLSSVLGIAEPGPLQVYLPLLTFAVLFGLSMDYEVFLVSRIREEWRRTGDNRQAVALGIAHTAGVITAAATIMVAVFAAFLLASITDLQELGFALAVAVLLDATIVRLLLVPSVMRLLGRANWWLPRPLHRLLPDVSLGEAP